jgi:hypothetical protein
MKGHAREKRSVAFLDRRRMCSLLSMLRRLSVVLIASAVFLTAEVARASEGMLDIAVLDLEAGGDIDSALAETLTSLVAQHVKDTGAFSVIAQQDVRRLISFEKMKAALTCDLDSSCLTEIGESLGVPLFLAGKIVRLDEKFLLTLTLTDVDIPKVIGRELVEAESALTLGQASALAVARLLAPVLEQHAGQIALGSVDEDLEVFLDGTLRGRTPLGPMRATPGTHRLEIKREGWRTFATDLVVPADGESVVQVVMVPLPATHAALVRDATIQVSLASALAATSIIAGLVVAGAFFGLGEYFKATLTHPIEGDPFGRSIVRSDTAAAILVSRGAGTFAVALGAVIAIPLVGIALSTEWPDPLPEGDE